MIAATDTQWAPWYLARTDDKKRGRINILTHLLEQIPYEREPVRPVKLPARQSSHGYREPDYPFTFIPEID